MTPGSLHRLIAVLVLLALGLTPAARGHEIRPGLLEITILQRLPLSPRLRKSVNGCR